jgi:hypothetical protein
VFCAAVAAAFAAGMIADAGSLIVASLCALYPGGVAYLVFSIVFTRKYKTSGRAGQTGASEEKKD